jgi:hypothetical protein
MGNQPAPGKVEGITFSIQRGCLCGGHIQVTHGAKCIERKVDIAAFAIVGCTGKGFSSMLDQCVENPGIPICSDGLR